MKVLSHRRVQEIAAPTFPRTILFLISDTGAGHRSAATAIVKGLHLVYEPASGVDIRIVDVFAECGRFPLRETVSLYGPVTQHRPGLYGQIFHMTNSTERFNAANRLCQPFLRQGLRSLIERTRPDVIVSVHPLLNHVTLQMLDDLGLRIPVITVVTDLVSAHVSWFARGVAACIVPTQATKNLALANGLPPQRVHVFGMPLDPTFATRTTSTVAERRRALHLDASLPVVLLVGGGEGACGLADAVQELARRRISAQLLVVTGRNRQLFAQLQRLQPSFHTPTRLLGFVQNMPDLMRASDVIVTKAGPGTISEAVACGLPIVLTGALPGQEEGNIDFVLQNGLGALAPTPARLTHLLSELLDTSRSQLDQMRERARAISRPRAIFDIARLIVTCASQAAVRV